MSAQPATTTGPAPDPVVAVAGLIRFLETGIAPDGLFAPGRVRGPVAAAVAGPGRDRRSGSLADPGRRSPVPGQVRVERVEPTEHGFTIEFEERWEHEGQQWYCREMIRADVVDGTAIVELSIYCTGDWDEAKQREHADAVQLIRP